MYAHALAHHTRTLHTTREHCTRMHVHTLMHTHMPHARTAYACTHIRHMHVPHAYTHTDGVRVVEELDLTDPAQLEPPSHCLPHDDPHPPPLTPFYPTNLEGQFKVAFIRL